MFPITMSAANSSDIKYRYLTFFHYFKALEIGFTSKGWNDPHRLIEAMKSHNGPLQRSRALSAEFQKKLRQCLLHSWNSQVLLYQYQGMEEDYIAISLQWLPTKFYYTFYHSLQAYFFACGKPHTPTHSESLNVMTNDLQRLPGFLAAHCLQSLPSPTIQGLELDEYNRSTFSNLSRPTSQNFHHHIAKFLSTTREELLDDGFQNARKRLKRKTLSAVQKQDIDSKLKPVSIVHFLYRVRKRFNYEDAETVQFSNEDGVTPMQMYRAMRHAFNGMALSIEWLTAQYAGRTMFLKNFQDFKDGVKNKLAIEPIGVLEKRIQAYFE